MEMNPVFLFSFLFSHSSPYLWPSYNKLAVSQKYLQAFEHFVSSGTHFPATNNF